MLTLVLTRANVARSLNALFLLEDLRAAFRAHHAVRADSPEQWATGSLGKGASASVSFPGELPEIPAYTVRVEGTFPGAPASARSLLLLYSRETGALLAIMDADHLMNLRTGLVSALATDVLARRDASRVAILGGGSQGSVHLKCLRLVRTLTHVRVHSEDFLETVQFADRMYREVSLPVRAADSVEEAVEDADIVLSVRRADEPFVFPGMVLPGTHISTSTLAPGIADLAGDMLERSVVICDDRAQAVERGVAHSAGLGQDVIHAELGEVLAGTRPGRTREDQVTVFGGVGMPFLDLAAAWQVYQAAREDDSIHRIDFGA